MAKLILMVGNIGTGKTTSASRLMKDDRNILTMSDDAIARMLNDGHYGPDIFTQKHWPLYSEIKGTCARLALNAGFNIIIDGTHMTECKRVRFIDIADEFNAKVIVYLHEDSKEGLKRRLADPRGSALKIWRQVHERFENEYEPPTLGEGIDQIIRVN